MVLKKLIDKKINFNLTDGAKKFLVEKGFDPMYGARPLKRAIQKHIEDPIADELLKGKFRDGSTIQIKIKGNELHFSEMSNKKDKKESDITT